MKIAYSALISTLIVFSLFSLLFLGIIWDLSEEDKIEKVDCYDRFRNKILNQVCEEETFAFSLIAKIGFGMFGYIIIILMGIFLAKMEKRYDI